MNGSSCSPASPRLLADLAHLSIGALFVLGAAALFPKNRMAPYYGAIAIMAIAVIKDLTPWSYDIVVECDTFAAGVYDTVEYATGAGLALVGLALARGEFSRPRVK